MLLHTRGEYAFVHQRVMAKHSFFCLCQELWVHTMTPYRRRAQGPADKTGKLCQSSVYAHIQSRLSPVKGVEHKHSAKHGQVQRQRFAARHQDKPIYEIGQEISGAATTIQACLIRRNGPISWRKTPRSSWRIWLPRLTCSLEHAVSRDMEVGAAFLTKAGPMGSLAHAKNYGKCLQETACRNLEAEWRGNNRHSYALAVG